MRRSIRLVARCVLATHLLVTLWVTVVCGDTPKDPKIAAVSADKNKPTVLYILFDKPLPTQDDVKSTDYWLVLAKDKKGAVTKFNVASVDSSALAVGSTGAKQAILTLAAPLSLDTASVDVTLVNSKSIVHAPASDIFGAESTAPAPFKACTGKGDCDIYVTGSYTASLGGDPLYAVDSFGGYMHSIRESENYGKVGVYGQVQEKSSTTYNPDSFLTYLDYQYVLVNGSWFGLGSFKPFQAPIFNYRFAGTEFNKTGDDVNFVTSPMVTFPIRLSGKISQSVDQGITFPLLTLALGTEFVDVKKSVLAPTNAWHTRGLIGATFAGGIPIKKPFIYSIGLTSSYQLRLPSADEIYYDPKFAPINPTTGKLGTIPPRLGTQPRHYVDTKLTYNLVQWFGFTFEHTYGSLPPSFVITDHTFALGLTFTLAETSYGRYSILKP
jgi:hypothetical protein